MNILERITLKTDLKLAQIEKKLEFGNGTMGRWAKSSPTLDKATAVADFLNVSLDYLAGRDKNITNDPQIIPYDSLNPKIYEIEKVLESGNVSDDDIKLIEFILDKYKKQSN